ncbi:nuclear transport factor 2 family protein [Rhodocytophaga aerolata]|uniref:Nuclear transport factor 2 family protein n=1 Tax=Rhodocytophaga aerolata TaxID=455078 RepID=A0ABT8RFK2_9BACT|nr:nuclear transport factor 2 family protein [Rhodocytophaga aerolata]MDO1450476.1 nuclear transport factor 2 family protein [Rhodocytophaga aerolata]
MNVPKVIAELVKAQNNQDSIAYANCFSETALVYDEGKNHHGKKEIQEWIAQANQTFKTVMKPIGYTGTATSGVLSAEISGSFPGSPLVLNYHLELKDGLIESLKIKG